MGRFVKDKIGDVERDLLIAAGTIGKRHDEHVPPSAEAGKQAVSSRAAGLGILPDYSTDKTHMS